MQGERGPGDWARRASARACVRLLLPLAAPQRSVPFCSPPSSPRSCEPHAAVCDRLAPLLDRAGPEDVQLQDARRFLARFHI